MGTQTSTSYAYHHIASDRRVGVRLFLVLLFIGLLQNSQWSNAASRFGFSGPEVFPIGNVPVLLNSADLDADGMADLVVVLNSRSRICLLYNQTGNEFSESLSGSLIDTDLNELPPDARFRMEWIASENRISALVVEDLNGDQLPDIAYYGDPRELVIHYSVSRAQWAKPERIPIRDGLFSPNALITGDVNGDGIQDLILLGESRIYTLIGNSKGKLSQPRSIPCSGTPKSIQVLDLLQDGRNDLLLVDWANAYPFCLRFQSEDGRIGAENFVAFSKIRSYWAGDLNGDGHTETVCIRDGSGRVQLSSFVQRPGEQLSEGITEGAFRVTPLNRSTSRKRGFTFADLNGDDLPDILAAEPESGQISVYFQIGDGEFDSGKSFSTLTGISDIQVGDWDGDGTPEIFLLSNEERQVGVTSWNREQGIPFPTLLPIRGRPLVMTVGRLLPESNALPAVVVDRNGKRALVIYTDIETIREIPLNDAFKSTPDSVTFHDINQDGLNDLLIFVPYEKIKILLQEESGDFVELDILPPGGAMGSLWFSIADIDEDGRPELLLAKKNFVRAVVLKSNRRTDDSNWTFEVKEQINGAESRSRIVGAAMMTFPSAQDPSVLFLMDAGLKRLTMTQKDESGVWQVIRNLKLPLNGFTTLRDIPVSLKEGQLHGLSFQSQNSIGMLTFNTERWGIKEESIYETPIRNGILMDVLPGDFDQDGSRELVFLETFRHHLDIVTIDSEKSLKSELRWKVFEERSYQVRPGQVKIPEPREVLVDDFTNDGKPDLVVLVHDRILLYPQD